MPVWTPDQIEAYRDTLLPLHLPREFCPVTPTPKQETFLRRNDLEAFFGGSAGPGKSWALLMAALQYVDIPGYKALLLRPSISEFEQPGGLIEVAHDWLDTTPATWNGTRREWIFPSGAKLRFGYLANEGDIRVYKGPSYSFCVALGTGIRMADGSTKPIEQIEVGELVATLEGPRPVTELHRPGIKPCVMVETPQGASVVSATHRLLAERGWASPLELTPMSCQPGAPMYAESAEPPGAVRTHAASPSSDQPPALALAGPSLRRAALPETGAASAGGGSGCGASDGVRPVRPLPEEWSARLVLHVPAPRQGRHSPVPVSPGRALDHATGECVSQGSPIGCPTSAGSDDEPLRAGRANGRGHTPSPAALEGRSRSVETADGRANTRSGIRRAAATAVLPHPYTTASLDVPEDVHVRFCEARMARAGETEVCDLTVAGASHYITDAGIVSANCGFDELTSFPERLYRAMFRVLRQPKDGPLREVPLRMRSASNPGDIGHGWAKARFVDPRSRVQGAVYVPARITDNPFLDYEEYLKSLAHLAPVDRLRLINGDWDVMEEGGKFKRDDFNMIDASQADKTVAAVRYWDLAATEPSTSNPDPDYTVGLRLERTAAGRFVIRHIARARVSSEKVEMLVRTTAEADGRGVPQYIEQEPGASGKTVLGHYQRKVLAGFACYKGLPRGDKEVRSRPVAAAVANGLVDVIVGDHVLELLDEAAIFPNGTHDDIIDALSGAHTFLTKRPDSGGRRTSVPRGRIPGVYENKPTGAL